ncbi:MAG TPA: response regulator transcription factor [Deltaproteobacteria bacterium]|nr:response regulator transcription factor [Deltaproteobacteria bacterium]
MKKRIVIAEDHTILRDGLKALISQDPDLEIVGEACDGLDAIRVICEFKPDLALMDLSMPKISGIDAIREVKRCCPETKILVLTVHKTEEYVIASLKAGANGYLLKESTHHELLHAINHVLQGKPYLSPGISDTIISGYLAGRRDEVHTLLDTLTNREKEVLKLVAEGYKNKEIGEYLFISVKTVEKHRDNIMKKLNLHSASALTSFAIEHGLVEP